MAGPWCESRESYERKLVRIRSGADVLEGVSAELRRKYGSADRAAIESGEMWLFELAPRDSGTTGGSR